MIQGKNESTAWRIAKNGFGMAGTTEEGFFGRGIYFTSQFSYASHYSARNKEGRKVFLLSLVTPGNIFPVTEHPYLTKENGELLFIPGSRRPKPNPEGLLAQPCKVGYQSHYTLVHTRNVTKAFPDLRAMELGACALSENLQEPRRWEGKVDEEIADELVAFDPSQVLPLFLVYCDGFDQSPSSQTRPWVHDALNPSLSLGKPFLSSSSSSSSSSLLPFVSFPLFQNPSNQPERDLAKDLEEEEKMEELEKRLSEREGVIESLKRTLDEKDQLITSLQEQLLIGKETVKLGKD